MSHPDFLQEGLEAQAAHVVEELGEFLTDAGPLLAALGKTGRWGLDSADPTIPPEERETNRDWLRRTLRKAKAELPDVLQAIERLEATMDGRHPPNLPHHGPSAETLATNLLVAVKPFIEAAHGTSDFWADDWRMMSLDYRELRVGDLRRLGRAVAAAIKAELV